MQPQPAAAQVKRTHINQVVLELEQHWTALMWWSWWALIMLNQSTFGGLTATSALLPGFPNNAGLVRTLLPAGHHPNVTLGLEVSHWTHYLAIYLTLHRALLIWMRIFIFGMNSEKESLIHVYGYLGNAKSWFLKSPNVVLLRKGGKFNFIE